MEGDLLVNKPIGKKLGSQKKKEKKNKQTNKFCLRTHKPILCLTFKLWSVLTPCYLAACSVEKTNIMQNPGLHLYASSSHRIIESLNISSWKGPLRIMKSKSLLLSGLTKRKPYDQECCPDVPWTLTSLVLSPFPREIFSLPDHALSEEPFPNVQCVLLLMLFHSISLGRNTSHQRDGRSGSPPLLPILMWNTDLEET